MKNRTKINMVDDQQQVLMSKLMGIEILFGDVENFSEKVRDQFCGKDYEKYKEISELINRHKALIFEVNNFSNSNSYQAIADNLAQLTKDVVAKIAEYEAYILERFKEVARLAADRESSVKAGIAEAQELVAADAQHSPVLHSANEELMQYYASVAPDVSEQKQRLIDVVAEKQNARANKAKQNVTLEQCAAELISISNIEKKITAEDNEAELAVKAAYIDMINVPLKGVSLEDVEEPLEIEGYTVQAYSEKPVGGLRGNIEQRERQLEVIKASIAPSMTAALASELNFVKMNQEGADAVETDSIKELNAKLRAVKLTQDAYDNYLAALKKAETDHWETLRTAEHDRRINSQAYKDAKAMVAVLDAQIARKPQRELILKPLKDDIEKYCLRYEGAGLEKDKPKFRFLKTPEERDAQLSRVVARATDTHLSPKNFNIIAADHDNGWVGKLKKKLHLLFARVFSRDNKYSTFFATKGAQALTAVIKLKDKLQREADKFPEDEKADADKQEEKNKKRMAPPAA